MIQIDGEYLLERLRALLATPSPSGYTDSIVRECCAELSQLGVDYELTRRGAIRARVPGRAEQPARAIASHVDTLGAQVKRLKDNGRLEVVPIGTWSARFAEGARCTVFTDTTGYRGSILPLKASGHTYGDEVDSAPVGWEHVELRLDLKVGSADGLRDFGIAVGDTVAIDPAPEFLENGYVVSRHLDDKGGVAACFAALKALVEGDELPAVDTYFLFTVSEEVGVGASSVLGHDIAALVSVDNGTTAPGQNSSEYGVTIAMADQTGPFDFHLTRKLIRLCRDHGIGYQRDVFRHYRSDSAAALVSGADIRVGLVTFGIDASHGYERIHCDALESVARLLVAYARSEVQIPRDADELGSLEGFTRQSLEVSERPEAGEVHADEEPPGPGAT
ncbi:MAG TPA: osmoprotectant NAGGN system M42 family peptidase [Xanthomonadaceae bacterium]|nr:osmoprotectant NAGGN system M42 family peptidase [Xanthomonadaceae bacterium]